MPMTCPSDLEDNDDGARIVVVPRHPKLSVVLKASGSHKETKSLHAALTA
jgi:hypothetical protein